MLKAEAGFLARDSEQAVPCRYTQLVDQTRHPVSNNMLRHKLLHLGCASGMLLLVMLKLGSAGDSCSWKGSGLIRNPHSRAVEQIHLRCTQGSLLWMYPTRALRVILEPNLANGKYTSACMKPSSSFHGADIYVEKGDKMHLLVNEAHGTQQLYCFGMDTTHRVTLLLLANPEQNIRGGTVGFQYELFSRRKTGLGLQKLALSEAACQPCDDADLLIAVCSSDFVVRGSIRNVSHNRESRVSLVDISAWRIYRQRNRSDDPTGGWTGSIKTLLQCRVKKGPGDFLFTGSEHFGDAWLGCAPRFKDFLNIYKEAKLHKRNPCEFQTD
ncbi:meteorin-like protein [Xenopus laevis]|uniref:Meteorin-like protein n=2 Tax=Xenopus laevis TaxID=8355 RepID=A0A974BXE7_XENLA|nr:meteorin-like protein [Xenopus laevis]OCT62758.1 hypothetical protein XELAEV_18043849mg [Xenopus laevis]